MNNTNIYGGRKQVVGMYSKQLCPGAAHFKKCYWLHFVCIQFIVINYMRQRTNINNPAHKVTFCCEPYPPIAIAYTQYKCSMSIAPSAGCLCVMFNPLIRQFYSIMRVKRMTNLQLCISIYAQTYIVAQKPVKIKG